MKRVWIMLATAMVVSLRARAQTLPRTYADTLVDAGRWTEAESEFYAQSERAPRDPYARAALGQFLAMKGAVLPGIVLIEEAQRFGLSSQIAQSLLSPLRSVAKWRASAMQLTRDSTLTYQPPQRTDALFSAIAGNDIVDRSFGIDSVRQSGHPIGIEVLEALVPSVDTRLHTLTLHANPRSALSAVGRRYPVLRTSAGVRVLVTEGRVTTLSDALETLAPAWWQLDLVHGLLVIR